MDNARAEEAEGAVLAAGRSPLWGMATLFLRLGATAFGGPAAHIAMMEDEVVRRRWLSREKFLDLLGATNLIPGPNSTELAIHIGHHHAGWAGLVAQLRDVPVVVVTARDLARLRDRAELANFDDYLSKPFDFLKLNAISKSCSAAVIQDIFPTRRVGRTNPRRGMELREGNLAFH